jgi:hypothetical protein
MKLKCNLYIKWHWAMRHILFAKNRGCDWKIRRNSGKRAKLLEVFSIFADDKNGKLIFDILSFLKYYCDLRVLMVEIMYEIRILTL